MSTATMTSKGQVTIPLKIRLYLGLHKANKLEFIIEKNGRVVLEPLTTDVSELKGFLPKPKQVISVEQMNKAIAKRGADL
jgi:antitoxin PrlF